MNKIKLKHIIQIISLVAIVIFFLPTFVVSCSGESMKLSAMRLTIGVRSDGYTMVSPQLVCSCLIIIPVLLLLVWLIKFKLDHSTKNIITLVFSAVDVGMWCAVAAGVKHEAGQYYFQSRVTFWFVLNLILLFIALFLAICMNMKKLSGETSLTELFGIISNTAPNTNAVDAGPWNCTNCGTMMKGQANFCYKCGAPKPIIEVKPAARMCPNCGCQIEEGAGFCMNCGMKLM
ncbi:MAG: zinc ribbon domain-containing protein [Eubacterium sp.]|nr:zinc ribbon domain-containing protein [Eubacterium sp.]